MAQRLAKLGASLVGVPGIAVAIRSKVQSSTSSCEANAPQYSRSGFVEAGSPKEDCSVPKVIEITPGSVSNLCDSEYERRCRLSLGVVLSGKVELYVDGGHFPKTLVAGDTFHGCTALHNSWSTPCTLAVVNSCTSSE
jgi:hypothetical protein